jgi:hypothetical protein
MVGVAEILQHIDRDIAQLQRARALLTASSNGRASHASRNGVAKTGQKRRKLSPEGRRRIVEAVRRRWERQRKAAAGK